MDPLTHGLLGASITRGFFAKRVTHFAGIIGLTTAMSPDLDVLIHSATDPTLGWVFHRHFTHSIFCAPLIGVLCTLPWLLLRALRAQWRSVLVASIAAATSHGVLDLCTGYGTQWLWPFTNVRFSLDVLPIVDPMVTLTLLVGLSLSFFRGRPSAARAGFVLVLVYAAFGAWQHSRALAAQSTLIASRGDSVTHRRVMLVPGSLLLWRSLYLSDGIIHADGIRTPYLSEVTVLQGDTVPLAAAPQLTGEAARQFEVLRWFSDGFVGAVAGSNNTFADMRYSSTLQNFDPMWGLTFKDDGEVIRWRNLAGRDGALQRLISLLLTPDPKYLPISSLRRIND